MYFKLALKNVKKSFKDFLIYFLTLAFAVCLFYIFNSFQSQQAVLEMNASQAEIVDLLSTFMSLLSVFVTVVLAFLILYANNFLIRRRKRELGIYTLLGMPKGKISKILVYETLIIGIISLITGMLFGILLSQALTAVTASMFEVSLNYHFVFSPWASLITFLSFGGIFLLTMVFNTFVLNHYKLIDLINADRKNDEFKIKKVWISALIFMLSVIILGCTYYYAIDKGLLAFNNLPMIIAAGCLGTVLFFLSLAGFLLTVVKSNKKLYFHGLNSFILRQLHSNINSNFLSMSVVCIMLLLSIGALSTGMSLNNTINKTIRVSTPYDATISLREHYELVDKEASDEDRKFAVHLNEESQKMMANTKKLYESLNQKYADKLQGSNIVSTYLSDFTYEDLKKLHILNKDNSAMPPNEYDMPLMLIPLSVFNQELKVRDFDPIELKNDEIYIHNDSGVLADFTYDILEDKPTMEIFNKSFHVINDDFEIMPIGTTSAVGSMGICIVMPDSQIPKNATVYETYWNFDVIKDTDAERIRQESTNTLSNSNSKYECGYMYSSDTKEDVYVNSKGLSVVFTYIGIYLGIVFLMASAVILALQQLSQANDNKKRYTILEKIGTEKKMINRSIFVQIAIYFFLPLLLAIVHSIVGIQVVNNIVMVFGRASILTSSLITAGIIILIYGAYFLITYIGYKNICKTTR